MRITLVAGTRPNFVKIAPIYRAILDAANNFRSHLIVRLVHTGQHFDRVMSQNFFEDLCIPEPNAHLNCSPGSHSEVTASIMLGFEKELEENPADLVIVVGDVNSTLACSIVAKKLNTRLAHVEAGIRSGDLTMPEEINRIVTDSITDIFYTPSQSANQNLLNAGVPKESIIFVGNVMIDALLENLNRLRCPVVWKKAGLEQGQYIVLTMHRPATVDDPVRLLGLIDQICTQVDQPIVFPVHPRTKKILQSRVNKNPQLYLTDPLGYLEFIYLVKHSLGVISDSGGVSEETTVLDIPCITLRSNTERPETVSQGTNCLVGFDSGLLQEAIQQMLRGQWPKPVMIEKWDGKASVRIAEHLVSSFNG